VVSLYSSADAPDREAALKKNRRASGPARPGFMRGD